MKLKWRLDLNTLVLVLLIVIFSGILYVNFEKTDIIEGLPTSLTEAKNAVKAYNKDLVDHNKYKVDFDTAIREKGSYDSETVTVDGVLKDIVGSSSSGINLINRTVVTGRQAVVNASIAVYNDIIRDIKTKTGLSSTPNNQISGAIQAKINDLTKKKGDAELALTNLIKFTVDTVMPIDKGAVITVNYNPVISPANSYKITTNPVVSTMSTSIGANPLPATSVVTIGGLLNNQLYTFSIIADYGDGVKYTVSHPIGFIPRGKPNITVVTGTGVVDVTIVPPSDGLTPTGYTITKNSEATNRMVPVNEAAAGPVRFSNLSNDTPYTFSVIANYGGNNNSSPITTTVTPRFSPSGTGVPGNRNVSINIIKPSGVGPVSYLISGKQTVSQVNVPTQQVPYTTTSVSFAELENGKEYSFYVSSVHSDDSRSSPSSVIKVTPVSPPPRPPPPKKAKFYEHCGYKGAIWELGVGNYNWVGDVGIPNDSISSVIVPSGLTVVLYQHANGGGRSIKLTSDRWCLVDQGFNDATSSIQIY